MAWKQQSVKVSVACAVCTVTSWLDDAIPCTLLCLLTPLFCRLSLLCTSWLFVYRPSERLSFSMNDTLPGWDGHAAGLWGPWIRRQFSRGCTGPNEILTCQRSSLPPVSSAGIYPHPEVCSAIKHWSAFLPQIICFRTYFFPRSYPLVFIYSLHPLLCSFCGKTDAILWTTHIATSTAVEMLWRKSWVVCCSMRQLDVEHKNYGHVSFPRETQAIKKTQNLRFF